MGDTPPKNSPPDVFLVAITLFLALIAAYGTDQLLSGFQPSRRRWFTAAEETLAENLATRGGRGTLTIGRSWATPLRIHWSLPVGLLLVGGLQAGAWVGFLAVLFAHEFGHALLVWRTGQQVIALSFHALGGECQWVGRPGPRRRTLIAWGGVIGQAILLALAWSASKTLPDLFTGWFGGPLGRALVGSNLAMAAFNLLPIPPLDGAAAWGIRFRPRQGNASLTSTDAISEVVDSALRRARGDD